jgi:medium-chain acyl-[acyl-carrier-protein] hydrolase
MTRFGSPGTQGPACPWITCASPRPAARVRLLAFAHCGGGTRLFQAWPGGLPASVEVCPVLLPGREGRRDEEPLTSVAAIVRATAEALQSKADLPVVLFGHSLGGLIAFELARDLCATGRAPAALIVSACGAPGEPGAERRLLHRLPDIELIEAVAEFGGLPEELREDPEMRAEILPALRADFTALETFEYVGGAPLPMPIIAMGGSADPVVTRQALQGWRRHTARRFSLSLLPGGHFYLTSSQALFLRALSRELLAADGE